MDTPDRLPDQSWQAAGEIARPEEVRQYLIDEIFKAVGLRADSRWRAWFGPLFNPLVHDLARRAVLFDESVTRYGFVHTAQECMKMWISGLQTIGLEHLPAQGPVLIAANHPGTYDALAVASVLPRQDLRIVASGNPFFRALPNTRNYFIFATRDPAVRLAAIRRAIRHLQEQGALLIFPAGTLEPDPRYFKEAARQALVNWSASVKVILNKVPQTKLVLAINSGFVDAGCLRNPLTYIRPSDDGRQKIAEFIQVINYLLFKRKVPTQPSIHFGEPVSLPALESGPEDAHEKIIESAAFMVGECA